MNRSSSEMIRKKVIALLVNFQEELKNDDLRNKVISLVPIFNSIRNLGKSLIPKEIASAARDRIQYYFKKYPRTIISGDEILVVSGIQDWPRRIRELRVQFGWSIMNGVTAKQMSAEGDFPLKDVDISSMKPEHYILVSSIQDRDAAHRWHLANIIRRKRLSGREKILEYFRSNVGKPINGEELRYISNNASEWARRVRELRTEMGWPIVTRNTGRRDLDVGFYILQADRQSYEHDRRIPDNVRIKVLRRDGYKCTGCGWEDAEYSPSDPRHLELHHKVFHHRGGKNIEENLITLCTVCHDNKHSKKDKNV